MRNSSWWIKKKQEPKITSFLIINQRTTIIIIIAIIIISPLVSLSSQLLFILSFLVDTHVHNASNICFSISNSCRADTDPRAHTRTQLEEQIQLNTLCMFMKRGKTRLLKHTTGKSVKEGNSCTKQNDTLVNQ